MKINYKIAVMLVRLIGTHAEYDAINAGKFSGSENHQE